MFSNSLGTSTGDWLAGPGGLGLRGTALLLSAIMLMLLAAHYFTNINGMLLFWIAFILTRPLGAVLGNILSKSREHGGVDCGLDPLATRIAAFRIAAGPWLLVPLSVLVAQSLRLARFTFWWRA